MTATVITLVSSVTTLTGGQQEWLSVCKEPKSSPILNSLTRSTSRITG